MSGGAGRADAGGSLIEARDLELSFGATPALRGASLAADAGEMADLFLEELNRIWAEPMPEEAA